MPIYFVYYLRKSAWERCHLNTHIPHMAQLCVTFCFKKILDGPYATKLMYNQFVEEGVIEKIRIVKIKKLMFLL